MLERSKLKEEKMRQEQMNMDNMPGKVSGINFDTM